MQAYSIEKCIAEFEASTKALSEYIAENAMAYDAYQMESGIKEYISRIGLAATALFFAHKGTGDKGEMLTMADGTILKKQQQLCKKDYYSVFGKIPIPRTCYRAKAKPAIMPLDLEANLPKQCYSYLLQEYMSMLGLQDPFEKSAQILHKLLGANVYSNRFEAVSRNSCMSYDQYYKAKVLPDADSEGAISVCGFDGVGVPLIKSEAAKIIARPGKGQKRLKKKEAMVGVSYTIDPNVRTPEQVARNLVYPEQSQDRPNKENRAKNIRRLASLERSKEEVVHEIITDNRNRNPENKKPLVVVMDGALCLWATIMAYLGVSSFIGILDIIHVVEYLWKAANTLYGEESPLGRRWVYDNLHLILKGRVGRVIVKLKRMAKAEELKKNTRNVLKDCIRYFENHSQWMAYDEYLRAGYPIGSGVVESSCGHTVKDRMEGTGRRWSTEGAESVLLLRSVSTSGDWDQYWNFHMQLEKSFYYQGAMETLGIYDKFNEFGMVKQNSNITAVAA